MTIPKSLFLLLDEAADMASRYSGGYCSQFISAEAFHAALTASIQQLRRGDLKQLEALHYWFLPTSCWDDFVRADGMELGNKISNLLSTLTS